jgi:acetyl-CoA carboxylase biotin carboxylase subunit
MLRALEEYQVEGIRTTIPFHRWLLSDVRFIRGEVDTRFLDREFRGTSPEVPPELLEVAVIAAALAEHERERAIGGRSSPGDGGTAREGEGAGRGSPDGRMNPWKLAGRRYGEGE